MTTKQTLQNIRRRCRNKVQEDGIYLTTRFRGRYDAEDFCNLVRSLPESLVFVEKTHKARHTGDLVWKVAFTVDISADQYIAGRINLSTWESWVNDGWRRDQRDSRGE